MMAPLLQSRSDHRDAILLQVKTYQAIQDRKTVPLDGLQPLLASEASFLQEEFVDHEDIKGENEHDEFDEIEDEDLMLAEEAPSSSKRITPDDFDDESSPKKLKIEHDATSVSLAGSILQKTWGFPNFRHKQEQAIARLISGGSAAVVFPTGGGKSLVYQIPALAFDDYDEHCGRSPGGGVTLVVSPLIALMKVGCNWSSTNSSFETMHSLLHGL